MSVLLKNKTIRLFSILVLLSSLFGGYLWLYPNDFFLSDTPFKKSSDYQVKRSFFKYEIYYLPEKSKDLQCLISELDEALKEEEGWFKNNAKRTVSIVKRGQSEFFVKRYNSKNFLDYCSKCPFRSSKAFRSFYYAYLFKKEELPTPEPMALIEKRVGFLWTKCYLISKKIEGQSLKKLLEEENYFIETSTFTSQISHLLNRLYENKWVHRDLTPRNIFLHNQKLFFLDLDDIHAYAFKNYFFRKKFFNKHQKRLKKNLGQIGFFNETTFSTLENKKDVKLSG